MKRKSTHATYTAAKRAGLLALAACLIFTGCGGAGESAAPPKDVYKRQECKQRNYNKMKNKKNNPDRLEMNKYCRFCRKHTLHKETK